MSFESVTMPVERARELYQRAISLYVWDKEETDRIYEGYKKKRAVEEELEQEARKEFDRIAGDTSTFYKWYNFPDSYLYFNVYWLHPVDCEHILEKLKDSFEALDNLTGDVSFTQEEITDLKNIIRYGAKDTVEVWKEKAKKVKYRTDNREALERYLEHRNHKKSPRGPETVQVPTKVKGDPFAWWVSFGAIIFLFALVLQSCS